jgi:raffinose/stachyose/melibiose transport system substrate-binding protein
MKKAALLLAGLLLLSAAVVLTAAPKVVVKTMAYGDNSNPEGVNWLRIVAAFEKANPDIDIDFELLYDEAYHQKVVARLAAGDAPHLAYMGADARWGAPWKEASQQFDHKPFMDSKYYDLKLIPPMGPKGEIWEIPLGTSNITTVLYMNQKLVKSLGFTAPKTYQDIVAMVPAAKAKGLDVISIDGADGWAWGSCLMSSVIARMSGDPSWVSKAVAGKNKFTDKVFVDSLDFIARMIKDGVIASKSVMVDYGANLSNFSNEKALFMIQGQWIAGSIENPEVADNTVMMAWPKLPGEKAAAAGSVAAAISVGYGVTKAGAADPKVRDAALKFLQYFYSHEETTQRLRDGAIVAPVLKNFVIPDDLPGLVKQKVGLAQKRRTPRHRRLSAGPERHAEPACRDRSCQATAQQVASEVESLMRR